MPTVERAPLFRWNKLLSWEFVGWYVALLIGLWGTLMGTGDYSAANAVFILAATLFCVKWWHVTRGGRGIRRLLSLSIGVLAAFALVYVALHWTSGKAVEAAKQRAELAQLDGVPALQERVKRIPALQQQIDNLKQQYETANSKLQTKQDTVERLARALTSQLSRTETNLSKNITQYRTDTSTAVSKILRPGRTLGDRRAVFVRELMKAGAGKHEVAISEARGNQECLDFAKELETAFTEAGWHLARTHFGLLIRDGEKLRLIIKTGSNTPGGLTPDQLVVAQAFDSIGMTLQGNEVDNISNEWPVEVYVGLQ
jgi:hypothetical protein